jgi:hypothetical protein
MSEVKYELALTLVKAIDTHLKQGSRHYRNRSGRLLQSLDEVVNAILMGDLHIN